MISSITATAFITTPLNALRLRPSPNVVLCRSRMLSCVNRSKPMTARRHRSVVHMSLIPFIPNWLVLAAWGYGAYRFYQGFNRTSYQSSFRIPLALAWPLLFAINPSYRKNFTRSITGADDDF